MLHPPKKISASVRLILVFVWGTYYVPDTYVPHFEIIPGTYYVPHTYDTRYVVCTRYVCTRYHTCRCTLNSTAVSLFVYSLVGGGTHDTYVPPKKCCIAICLLVSARTFRPWTHTSDDSYIYQLSLVVATATVSSRLFVIC